MTKPNLVFPEKLQAKLKLLLAAFPSAFPVKARIIERVGPWEGLFAVTSLMGRNERRYFRVTVVDLSHMGWAGEQLMVDSLIHEYAHILNWNHSHDQLDCSAFHGPDWGTWYAACYRLVYMDT